MKVLVKVVMNQAEINAAHSTNQENTHKRALHKADPEEMTETLIDLPSPEPVIEKQPMLFDLAKVEMATIGDAGMIQIVYDGRAINTDYDKDVWAKLESRFDEEANQYCKNALCAHNN
jgi:hypothetical protein